MEDLKRAMTAVIAIAVAALFTLSLIFFHEFTSPDGAFRRAIGSCGDGFCRAFEADNCPADCGNPFLSKERITTKEEARSLS